MKFTGERFVPTEQGKIRLEHYHRYAIVLDAVAGKDVLDLACGEGYGSFLMADGARSVVGVDISNPTIRHAAKKYKKDNLKFLKGSATATGLPDASFDVVVSFETIEHLSKQEEMIAEIRRVMRPKGVLIISSPNRPIYSEESGEHNDFHVKELDFDEFDNLLKTQFPAVQYYGQRMLMGSVIESDKGDQDTYKAWHDDGKKIVPRSGFLNEPVYFVAIAGEKESYLPKIDSSIIYPNNSDLVKHYTGFAKWAKDLDVKVLELNKEIRIHNERNYNNNQTLTERDRTIGRLHQESLQQAKFAFELIEERKESQKINQDLNEEVVHLGKWGKKLNAELEAAGKRLQELSEEFTSRSEWALRLDAELEDEKKKSQELNGEIARRSRWGMNLNLELNEEKKRSQELNEQVEHRSAWALRLEAELESERKRVKEWTLRLETELESERKRSRELTEEVIRRGEWGLGLDAELGEERKQTAELREKSQELWERSQALKESLDAAINSNSWKLTLPLREARLWIDAPKQQTKRYLKKSLSLVKEAYQSLPFSVHTIESHRNAFVKYAPKLLTATETRLDGYEQTPIPMEDMQVVIPELPQEQTFFESPVEVVNNAETIEICSSKDPLVSVIIPVYGQIDYTLNCLASIAANPSRVPFEIIVVDDCSPDNSTEILKKVKGIILLENENNQGFIRSCNIGANTAKGKYLYFLNNDTQVTSGWMDELVRTFHEFPETGLVGSKLIYPDGRLQEAGGIIWQDGSAWNFGRFQDATLPIYNYAREVDYCSGASIMIPKTIFKEMSGFDEHYLPAYCEDSDLALKIRAKGYRVIYQPLSTIIHYEGITSGTETSEGVKSYQVKNSAKLYARWKNLLQSHQAPGIEVDDEKDRTAKYRVLVLEHCTPTPDQDAGSVTVVNFLLLLREMGFQVTFIPEDNLLFVPEYTAALQRAGIEVLYFPYIESVEQHLQEYGDRYDLAFLFRPKVVERHIKKVRKYCSRAKVLYYTHDLHFLRMMREAELFKDAEIAALAKEMKFREFDAINASDISIIVSEQELDIIKNKFPKNKLYVFPLILNITGTKKRFSDRKNIVFVGGFQHTPNIDSVHYFVSEIMPLLRRSLPGVHFYVVGSKPPAEINDLACKDVIITGFVEDLTSLLDKMRVSVAPLRYGAGIKGKIGTAMAAGLPVVATSIAAEGMSLIDGDNVFVADTPENFAKAIVKVYQDEQIWNKISKNSVEFAGSAWGAERTWDILAGILSVLDFEVVKSNRSPALYRSSLNLFSEILDKGENNARTHF